jgi:hypothetical protein
LCEVCSRGKRIQKDNIALCKTPVLPLRNTGFRNNRMENTMTDHRLPHSTVSGSLWTAVVAALLASAPISPAAADGSSTGSLQDLQSRCGTVLAEPGFASGAASAACQSYNASHVNEMNGERGPGPHASGEYPHRINPN